MFKQVGKLSMNKAVMGLGIGVLLCGGIYLFSLRTSSSCVSFEELHTREQGTVVHDHITMNVWIARTNQEHSQGLSDICSVPEHWGMLFVFEKEGIYPFWMKDMYIPLDIAWIDSSLHVVDMIHHWSPETYPETRQTTVPIRYVLELPAGTLEENNIMIGDQFILP